MAFEMSQATSLDINTHTHTNEKWSPYFISKCTFIHTSSGKNTYKNEYTESSKVLHTGGGFETRNS